MATEPAKVELHPGPWLAGHAFVGHYGAVQVRGWAPTAAYLEETLESLMYELTVRVGALGGNHGMQFDCEINPYAGPGYEIKCTCTATRQEPLSR